MSRVFQPPGPGRRAVTLALCVLCISSMPAALAQEGAAIEIGDYAELSGYYERLGYTARDWTRGRMERVPRIFLGGDTQTWTALPRAEGDLEQELFFRALLPMVLYINEGIADERTRLSKLADRLLAEVPIPVSEREWLGELAVKYGVVAKPTAPLEKKQVQELLRRVDVVPAALALAQAAYTNGFSTDAFVGLAPALDGLWLRPGDVKRYVGREDDPSPVEAIEAYIMTLNLGRGFEDFRVKREAFRRAGKLMDGYGLVPSLTRRPKKDAEYVDALQDLIRLNFLERADLFELQQVSPVEIVPRSAAASGGSP